MQNIHFRKHHSNGLGMNVFYFEYVSRELTALVLSLDGDLTILDSLGDGLSGLAIDGATERNAGSKDFFDSTGEGNSHGFSVISHGFGNSSDIIELDVSVVRDVLDLLSISATLLEGLNDEWSSGVKNGDSALSVLDGNLDLNLDSLPL